MADALWHKVSEEEKEKIREQAKKIMDNFAAVLEPLEHETREVRIERQEDTRQEINGKEADPEFRKIMFKNAKNKNGKHIIAEKGEWV